MKVEFFFRPVEHPSGVTPDKDVRIYYAGKWIDMRNGGIRISDDDGNVLVEMKKRKEKQTVAETENKLAVYSKKHKWITVYLGSIWHCEDIDLAEKLLSDLEDAIMEAEYAKDI